MKISKMGVLVALLCTVAGLGGYIIGLSKKSVYFMPEPLDEGHHMACCMADGWRDFAFARLLDDMETSNLSDERILLRYRINIFYDLLYHYAVNEKYDVKESLMMLNILEQKTGMTKEELLDYAKGKDFFETDEQMFALRLKMSQGYFSRLWLWEEKNYQLAKEFILRSLKNIPNKENFHTIFRTSRTDESEL